MQGAADMPEAVFEAGHCSPPLLAINVGNGTRIQGYNEVPACIFEKTSFTFYVDTTSRLRISQVNGGTFSGTDGWDNTFTK
jgi:hypothetical protein